MSCANRLIVLVVFVLGVRPASAFDPFTAIAGSGAASGFWGGLGDAAEVGISLGDLLVELEVDPTADQEAEAAVRKLEKLKSQMNEAKYFKQEVESVMNFDELKAKSHAQKLKQIRQMVQMLKKISTMFGLRPKAAEKANQVQQTQINYLMLEEMMAMRRMQFQAYLDNREGMVQRRVLMEKLEEEERQARANLHQQYRSRRRVP